MSKHALHVKNFLSSTQSKLALLVLIVFLPSFGLFIYSTNALRSEKLSAVEQRSLSFSREASIHVERIAEGSYYLLTTLSKEPEIQVADPTASSKRFAEVLPLFPLYANIFALNMDGDIYASAVSLPSSLNSKNLSYFTEVMKTNRISFGDYRLGRIVNKAVLVSAAPVYDEEGKMKSIIAASLDLAKIKQELQKIQIPAGSVLAVLDGNGVVLASNIATNSKNKWEGNVFVTEDVLNSIIINNGFTKEMKGLDGVKRVYSFVPVQASYGKIFVAFGDDKANVYSNLNNEFYLNIGIFSLVLLLALISAYLLSRMTKKNEEEMKRSEEKYRSVFNFAPVPFAMNDDKGNITLLNPKFIEVFGYTLSDIPTLSEWWERAYPDIAYRKKVSEEWSRRLEKAKKEHADFEPFEVKVVTKKGDIKYVIATCVVFNDEHIDINLVVLYDVTQERTVMNDLKQKNEELDKMNEIMMGREARIIELKEELEKQKSNFGKS